MRRSAVILYLSTFTLGLLVGADLAVRADLSGSGIFPDVEENSYYDVAVGALYEGGIITGYQDGRFGPNDPVTRGQVAVIMKRFADKIGVDLSGSQSRSSRARSSAAASSEAATVPGAGTLSFSTTNFDISESTASVSVNIARTGGSEGEVRVSWKTASGTAVAGEDFTQSSGQVVFDDGETSQIISVPMKNDSSGESAETFTITLSNPTGGGALGTSVVTVRILDNDGGATGASSSAGGGTTSSAPAAGGFRFGGSAYAIAEDAGQLTVVVERAGGTSGSVEVQYETVEISGGADDSSDFTTTSGTLSFAGGESEKSFTVNIIDDNDSGGDKKFQVRLKSPTGGSVLLVSSTDVTIKDDDISGVVLGSGSLRFKPDEYRIAEGSSGNVTIERISGTAGVGSVKVMTGGGSAGSSDFTAIDTTVTFRSGESAKTVTVAVKADNVDENNPEETFSLSLSNPVGLSIGTPSLATITIDD